MSMDALNDLIDSVIGNPPTMSMYEFDEFKYCKVNKNLSIYSGVANLNVYSTTGNKISIYLTGKGNSTKEFKFEINETKDKTDIRFYTNGDTENVDIKMDIYLPDTKFDNIKIESFKGNIDIVSESINCKSIDIFSPSGSINCNCTFENIKAHTIEKEISICIYANTNININASSCKGNIALYLSNIKSLKFPKKSCSGIIYNNFVKNAYKPYIAVASIRSEKGKINIYS